MQDSANVPLGINLVIIRTLYNYVGISDYIWSYVVNISYLYMYLTFECFPAKRVLIFGRMTYKLWQEKHRSLLVFVDLRFVSEGLSLKGLCFSDTCWDSIFQVWLAFKFWGTFSSGANFFLPWCCAICFALCRVICLQYCFFQWYEWFEPEISEQWASPCWPGSIQSVYGQGI